MSDALKPVIERCYRNIYRKYGHLTYGHLSDSRGGPVGATADIVVARLFGFDGGIDREVMLTHAMQVVEIAEPKPVTTPLATSHRVYHLHNGYARTLVDARLAPDATRTFFDRSSLLCLRYRRSR